MQYRTLNQPGTLFLLAAVAGCLYYCNNKSGVKTKPMDEIKKELAALDSLLRNDAFAQDMAATLDAAYYEGIGQTTPPFLTPEEQSETITVAAKEEKIAVNLAGFYALQCGVGLLCKQTNETPVAWLERIAANKTDTASMLLLNRFANATWKAGQPFRDLGRITRYNFTGFHRLSKEEVEKDAVQIRNAATKLSSSLQTVKTASLSDQMLAIKGLMQNETYAAEMAAYLDSTYGVSQTQKPAPFSSPAADTAVIKKPAKNVKIATNLAGFYALECAVNYLATTRNLLPSGILQSLLNKTLSKEDEELVARFANATWQAGQPFRGLNRIRRAVFTPFDLLSEADVEKDLVQVRAAAKKVLPLLKK